MFSTTKIFLLVAEEALEEAGRPGGFLPGSVRVAVLIAVEVGLLEQVVDFFHGDGDLFLVPPFEERVAALGGFLVFGKGHGDLW